MSDILPPDAWQIATASCAVYPLLGPMEQTMADQWAAVLVDEPDDVCAAALRHAVESGASDAAKAGLMAIARATSERIAARRLDRWAGKIALHLVDGPRERDVAELLRAQHALAAQLAAMMRPFSGGAEVETATAIALRAVVTAARMVDGYRAKGASRAGNA